MYLNLGGAYETAAMIAADKTCITSFELLSKCYFFSSKRYLHLMIEDALFSLQMYMRPLEQSELRERKRWWPFMDGWRAWPVEWAALMTHGQTDPQTRTQLYIKYIYICIIYLYKYRNFCGRGSGEKTTRGEGYLGSHHTPRNCRPLHTDNSVTRRVA